jgi:hypothetical protein
MPGISIKTNARQAGADLIKIGEVMMAEAVEITRVDTGLVEQLVKQNASGRPGPNIITGKYRATIHSLFYVQGLVAIGVVTSDAAQAERLENGFIGTDALGRMYHQPAFPHFQPAADVIGPLYYASLERIAA